VLDIANLLRRKVPTLQAFTVNPLRARRLTGYHRVGRNVTADPGVHAKKGMRANPAKLMGAGKSCTYHPVTHMNMTGERRVIRHDGFVANYAVMRDMTVGHDQVVVAQNRLAGVLYRSTADRTKLANRVPITDCETCRLVGVLLVLWIITDGGKLIDMIIFAYFRRAVDDDVTVNPRTAANFDMIADYGVRADLNIVGDSCFV
jgi:hypothetical protein